MISFPAMKTSVNLKYKIKFTLCSIKKQTTSFTFHTVRNVRSIAILTKLSYNASTKWDPLPWHISWCPWLAATNRPVCSRFKRRHWKNLILQINIFFADYFISLKIQFFYLWEEKTFLMLKTTTFKSFSCPRASRVFSSSRARLLNKFY